MPIGEALAEARQRAGLTVAQVSEQTRIRPTVIEGIEGDDYSACGGDFYARANIRSIAKVVGADSGPLIAEYDALYRARGPLSAVSLEELLATSVPAPRRPEQPAAGEPVASGDASPRRRAGSPVAGGPAGPAYRPRGRWVSWVVVLGLLGVLGFGVYSRLPGPRQAAAAPPAAGKHAVTHQRAGRGGPGPAPKPTHAAAAPAPAPTITHAAMAPAPPAAPVQTLAPAGARAPGPGRGGATPARPTAGGNPTTGGNPAAGQARPPAPDRPLPTPVRTQGPAPEQQRPSDDRHRPGHHRKRAPDVRPTAGRPGQQAPGERYTAGQESHA